MRVKDPFKGLINCFSFPTVHKNKIEEKKRNFITDNDEKVTRCIIILISADSQHEFCFCLVKFQLR